MSSTSSTAMRSHPSIVLENDKAPETDRPETQPDAGKMPLDEQRHSWAEL
jgi:hypothetical protein